MTDNGVARVSAYEFLTVDCAQKLLDVSKEETERVLTTAAEQNEKVQLLFSALSAVNDGGIKFTCGLKPNVTSTADLHLYGMLTTSEAPGAAATSASRYASAVLCPSTAATDRAYPLKTREQMETLKGTVMCTTTATPKPPPLVTVKAEPIVVTAKPPPTTAVKVEVNEPQTKPVPVVKSELVAEPKQTPIAQAVPLETKPVVKKEVPVAPAQVVVPVSVAASPSSVVPTVIQEEDSVTEVRQTASDNKENAVPPTQPVSVQQTVTSATPAAAQPKASPPAKRQVTLFGSAMATKRSRETSPATKGTGKPTRVKKEKPETKSLAKLAKASSSAKQKTGTTESVKSQSALQASLFDDNSNSSVSGAESACDETGKTAIDSAEHSVIDVEVTAANDEVVLFEDAPPLAFCKAEAPKRERAPKAEDPSEVAQQPKISNFFNPDLMAFQKDFVREVDTEMKKVGDEFYCTDIIVYRSVKTGEKLSEKEYHRRAAQISAQAKPNTSPSKTSEPNADSPPAAQASTTSTNKVQTMKIKQEQKNVAKPAVKTLFSYFKV